MKKWLAFLLLLVSTAATFYPCYSVDDCCADELVSSNKSPDDHQSESNCSPFITCGTCPGFTQTATLVYIPVVQEDKPVHHCMIVTATLSSYMASLLQPPRIA